MATARSYMPKVRLTVIMQGVTRAFFVRPEQIPPYIVSATVNLDTGQGIDPVYYIQAMTGIDRKRVGILLRENRLPSLEELDMNERYESGFVQWLRILKENGGQWYGPGGM